ncbi:cytochrome c biogenesis CcdA family protein [Undibacterium parvum]|uniref:Cytochrome c biogenesis protein CcdA n=2 Tax=Undibacterium TaxID=401469 RepID=A0A6M4AB57_9BURK|nr:cytochrome c biogenesis protein CcdA [Undibacterium parvum]AZP12935.1 cytochrome c biogenesis protein CcdA [Undibacterium parvum]QJQ07079.1 cytochrome c biogenesis protein CcdA [Undibacterium piscinae]
MSLEFASVSIALVAGVLSVLSPCVWPLVPIVMTSASGQSRLGPIYLALGLSLSFAIAGAFLSFILLNLGLNPDAFRSVAAVLMVLVGLILVVKPLADWINQQMSMLSSRFDIGNSSNSLGQFGVGLLLGLVWLPCVGPTLGAAIAVASIGQDLGMAFLVMFAFGIGTAFALLLAAFVSGQVLKRVRPGLFSRVASAKIVLGYLLIVLGGMILVGLDKTLAIYANQMLPDWAISL